MQLQVHREIQPADQRRWFSAVLFLTLLLCGVCSAKLEDVLFMRAPFYEARAPVFAGPEASLTAYVKLDPFFTYRELSTRMELAIPLHQEPRWSSDSIEQSCANPATPVASCVMNINSTVLKFKTPKSYAVLANGTRTTMSTMDYYFRVREWAKPVITSPDCLAGDGAFQAHLPHCWSSNKLPSDFYVVDFSDAATTQHITSIDVRGLTQAKGGAQALVIGGFALAPGRRLDILCSPEQVLHLGGVWAGPDVDGDEGGQARVPTLSAADCRMAFAPYSVNPSFPTHAHLIAKAFSVIDLYAYPGATITFSHPPAPAPSPTDSVQPDPYSDPTAWRSHFSGALTGPATKIVFHRLRNAAMTQFSSSTGDGYLEINLGEGEFHIYNHIGMLSRFRSVKIVGNMPLSASDTPDNAQTTDTNYDATVSKLILHKSEFAAIDLTVSNVTIRSLLECKWVANELVTDNVYVEQSTFATAYLAIEARRWRNTRFFAANGNLTHPAVVSVTMPPAGVTGDLFWIDTMVGSDSREFAVTGSQVKLKLTDVSLFPDSVGSPDERVLSLGTSSLEALRMSIPADGAHVLVKSNNAMNNFINGLTVKAASTVRFSGPLFKVQGTVNLAEGAVVAAATPSNPAFGARLEFLTATFKQLGVIHIEDGATLYADNVQPGPVHVGRNSTLVTSQAVTVARIVPLYSPAVTTPEEGLRIAMNAGSVLKLSKLPPLAASIQVISTDSTALISLLGDAVPVAGEASGDVAELGFYKLGGKGGRITVTASTEKPRLVIPSDRIVKLVGSADWQLDLVAGSGVDLAERASLELVDGVRFRMAGTMNIATSARVTVSSNVVARAHVAVIAGSTTNLAAGATLTLSTRGECQFSGSMALNGAVTTDFQMCTKAITPATMSGSGTIACGEGNSVSLAGLASSEAIWAAYDDKCSRRYPLASCNYGVSALNPAYWQLNKPITLAPVACDAAKIVTFRLSPTPALPEGISFEPSTGQFLGTPSLSVPTIKYEFTVTPVGQAGDGEPMIAVVNVIRFRCGRGYYCPSEGVSTLCPAGHYCPVHTIEPIPCSPGTFCLSGSSEERPCPAGSACSSPSVRSACSRGSHCPLSTVTEEKCPAGSCCSYDTTQKTECVIGDYCPQGSECNTFYGMSCPSNFYCPNASERYPCTPDAACVPRSIANQQCPAGTFMSTTVGLDTKLQPCGLLWGGDFCAAGSRLRLECPPGFQCPVPDVALPCPKGADCSKNTLSASPCPTQKACPSPGESLYCPIGTLCPMGSLSPITCDNTEETKGFVCFGYDVMQPCAPGAFCNSTAEQNSCTKGQYCPQGTFLPLLCPAGSYCPSPREAKPCDTGSWCPEGQGVQAPCPAGSRCPTPAQKIACNPGSYCPVRSTEEKDCPAGSVCNTPDVIAQCPAGSFCPARSTSPTLCDPNAGVTCPAGSQQPIPCEAGYYCPNPAFSPSKCDAPGDYCEANSIVRGRCPGGFKCVSATVKEPCARGTMCPTGSVDSTPCVDNATTRGMICPPQAAGYVDCPAGNVCKSVLEEPKPCNQTKYCPAKSTEESVCAAGFVCETPATQVKCASGMLCPDGSTAAVACPAAYYCPKAAEKVQCDPGHYCPGQVEAQLPCPKGQMAPNNSMTVCTRCAPGYAAEHVGSLTCSVCPTGKYAQGEGAEECLSCGTGSTTKAPGATSSSMCVPTAAGGGGDDGFFGNLSNTLLVSIPSIIGSIGLFFLGVWLNRKKNDRTWTRFPGYAVANQVRISLRLNLGGMNDPEAVAYLAAFDSLFMKIQHRLESGGDKTSASPLPNSLSIIVGPVSSVSSNVGHVQDDDNVEERESFHIVDAMDNEERMLYAGAIVDAIREYCHFPRRGESEHVDGKTTFPRSLIYGCISLPCASLTLYEFYEKSFRANTNLIASKAVEILKSRASTSSSSSLGQARHGSSSASSKDSGDVALLVGPDSSSSSPGGPGGAAISLKNMAPKFVQPKAGEKPKASTTSSSSPTLSPESSKKNLSVPLLADSDRLNEV